MEDDLGKLLKSLEAEGLIQARINYKGKQSEYDKDFHGPGALEQKENKLYIQALEFIVNREIEKATKLLEALLLLDPSHKKGKEILDKLKRKEHKMPNLYPVGTQSDRTQDIKNGKKKKRFVKSLLGHFSFFIILMVGLYLDNLARANDPDYISILLGFIISYIFSYFGYYYSEQIYTGINRILNIKIGKQLLMLLLLLIILIIVLLFKYLVMSFPRSGNLWENIANFLIFGVPIGCGIGFGLAAFLKGKS